jgi:Glycosyl-hydrolase family 116, catalytic region
MSDNSSTSAANSSSGGWISFVDKANRFLEKTQEHALQGINPGGVYQAIWCRDAAYILKDWFLSGNVDGVMQHIYQIWSHQIEPNKEKVVYGRGSPEMKFSAEEAVKEKEKEFQGALPTTIYQAGFSEVYGQNPDIDSTALMVSATSWILVRCMMSTGCINKQKDSSSSTYEQNSTIVMASERSSDYISALLSKVGITDPQKVAEFVVPRMFKAIRYLNRRDTDNDGLLEQGHNEDWMDTALRAGKIVYSQGCWLLALSDLSSLLSRLGRKKESDRLIHVADKTIRGVEQKLWSAHDGCYIDIQESPHSEPYRILTQDVSFYLIGISQNTISDSLGVQHHHHRIDNKQVTKSQEQGQSENQEKLIHPSLYKRAISTLDAIRKRAWKEKWPLVTETELKRTGPWVLKPYQYHNHTFWPWTTGIEMLARSRFNKIEEYNILFSKLASEGHPNLHVFYEWINPITDEGSGAYPFRTGITAIRIALADMLKKIDKSSYASSIQ